MGWQEVYGDDDHTQPSSTAGPRTALPPVYVPPDTQQQEDKPSEPLSILNTAWQSIASVPPQVWNFVKGAASLPSASGKDINAGIDRGVKDLTDNLAGAPPNLGLGLEGPQAGIVPGFMTPPTADETRQQRAENAAERQRFEQQYPPDHPAQAARNLTTQAFLAPAMWAGGEALSSIPRVGEFLAGSGGIERPGFLGMGERAASRGTAGGIFGGTGATLTSDPSQPFLPQLVSGVASGGVAAPAIGAGYGAISDVPRRLVGGKMYPDVRPFTQTDSRLDPSRFVSPNTVSQDVAERGRQGQVLLDNDVPVYTHQVSNDPVVQATRAAQQTVPWPLGAGGSDTRTQLESWRRGILRQADSNPDGTDSVLSDQYRTDRDARIDNLYQTSIRQVPSIPELGIKRDLQAITIPGGLTTEQAGQIRGAIGDVTAAFNNGSGTISGADYQRLTNRSNSALSPLYDSDSPTVRAAAWQIRAALDSRAQSVMSADQIDKFRQANQQFRAAKTIDAVTNTDRTFTPGELSAEAQRVRDAYGGTGTIDELAHAGNTIIQPTLDSTPGPWARAAGKAISAIGPVGYGAAAHIANMLPEGLLGYALAGGIVPAVTRGVGILDRWGPRAVRTAVGGGGNPALDIGTALQQLSSLAAQANQRKGWQ
jgi:hypothetical protein